MPELDRQHRDVVEKVIDLIASVDGRRECAGIHERLKQFGQIMRGHFAYEERLMYEHSFPGTATHIARHHHLLDQLDNVGMRLCSPALSGSNAELLLSFLVDWTELHIFQDRREWAAYLASIGMISKPVPGRSNDRLQRGLR